jgi:disulfide bond formation protein DsbB
VSRLATTSLAGAGNQLALAAIVGMLSYAFIDQFLFEGLPCILCIMQRISLVIIGFALVLNIRFGAHSAHYGWGILAAIVGMMVSLRQVLLRVAPGDAGYSPTFLEIHFYTWAFVAFVGLIAGQAILLMLPNREVRSCSFIASTLIVLFMILVFANLTSTLLQCGVGACANDPVQYDGWLWLRSYFKSSFGLDV